MAATKRKRPVSPCAHVQTQMVAYMAGQAKMSDRVAAFWCPDCGALIHKRGGGPEGEEVTLPRAQRP